MPKAAIVVRADTDGHEALGRLAHALYAVREFKESDDKVKLVFDGSELPAHAPAGLSGADLLIDPRPR